MKEAPPQKTGTGVSPVIAVDRNAATPIHRQIYNAYRTGIVSRNLAAGQQVPSSRALAMELSISRIPVLEAYAQLLAEGYFETRTGAGTFVSTSLPAEGVSLERRRRTVIPVASGARPFSRRSALLPDPNGAPWAAGRGPFNIGTLAYEHFPFSVWSNLMARHARKVRASSLNYGDGMGVREFRETIAAYLRTARAVQCDAGQIMVVGGSQQALDLCARVLMDPGDPVWIEEPGYQLMRQSLQLAGCRIVPVPVDAEGLNVAAGLKRCINARAAYVTPSHQYPLGMTMSASRRLQLLDWAEQKGAWIVEDDYDSEYRFESMPIASLQGLDHASRVVYIGTFSKTLFPALRLGYLVIPPDLVDRFIAVRRATDICAPSVYQAVLTDFMDEGHFARHVRRTRMLYYERRSALVDAVRQELGEGFEMLGSEAGMHLVLTLPPGMFDREISLRAAKENLWLWPLSTTYFEEEKRHGFILGFGSAAAADMPRAVRHLKSLLAV